MKIYLAGATGYLPTCRQVRGKNMGMLVSFFDCSTKQLLRMLKVMKAKTK